MKKQEGGFLGDTTIALITSSLIRFVVSILINTVMEKESWEQEKDKKVEFFRY